MSMNGVEYAYFGAANTAGGFRSLFSSLFDPYGGAWQRLYILKGGPGTGKSWFLRRCAEEAERRGEAVEYIYCSSDTASLDGIRIPSRGVAVYDGTAPHTGDPAIVGAVEQIVHLGAFLDSDALAARTGEIRARIEQKRAHYVRAGRYLRAAGSVRAEILDLCSQSFLHEKARAAARRTVRAFAAQAHPDVQVRFFTAHSVQGCVHLPTLEKKGACVPVCGDGAPLFLAALCEAAALRGVSYVRCADPLCPEDTEGVWFSDAGIGYLWDRYGVPMAGKPLQTRRFIDADAARRHRSYLRFAKRCQSALLEGAYSELALAGECHGALERIYTAAMDFDALNRYCDGFLREF